MSAMYDPYIMRRTQIYLEEAQDAALEQRARARGKTKSAVIREAIDAHLSREPTDEERLAEFHAAIDAAAGIAPYLTDEGLAELRAADVARQEMLERHWRGRG